MATLHNEAREIYKRLNKRHKQTGDMLDAMTLKIIARCMKQIPEHKEGGLHPIHRELILCFQGSIRSEKRDRAEVLAFSKIEGSVSMDDAKLLRWFYHKNKAREFDETWQRKADVKTLMNNITSQLEAAEAYEKKHKRHSPAAAAEAAVPVAPADWRSRAPGNFGNPSFSSWEIFANSYPEMVGDLIAGKDLS